MTDKNQQFLYHVISLNCGFYKYRGRTVAAGISAAPYWQTSAGSFLVLCMDHFTKTDQQQTTQNYSLKLETDEQNYSPTDSCLSLNLSKRRSSYEPTAPVALTNERTANLTEPWFLPALTFGKAPEAERLHMCQTKCF